VKHLRHAVGDEAAIETLRGVIRADEGADENIEDETEERDEDGEYPDQEEEDEEYSDEYDNTPAALDYIPVKREDNTELSEVFMPQSLADDDRQEYADDDDDEDDAEEYERNMFLRERLRQYLLHKNLDAIRNQIEDDDNYDVSDEWSMSKLSPAYDNIYSGFVLSVFIFVSTNNVVIFFPL